MSKTCSDLIQERTVDPEVFADMDNFDLVNNPTAFAKSLRLQFPKFSKGFSSSDFEEFVQEHVGVENLKSLGRLNFPNEWQMEVESQDVREKLIRWGKTKIKNRSCWISPLCTSEIRGFVHWLPNNIPSKKVKDLLSDYGEVLFIENQKQSLWNGKVASDSRYYALYLRAGKSKEDLPHFAKIENCSVLVTVRGRNPACFHCRESGHRKNECKKYKNKLNSYCQRPAESAAKRRKPRGTRFVANIKDSKDSANVPETQNNEVAAVSSGIKQQSTEPKVPSEKKTNDSVIKQKLMDPKRNSEKKTPADSGTKQNPTDLKVSSEKTTPANPALLPNSEELVQLKLKMAELISETVNTFEKKIAKHLVPPENINPASIDVEKKKKKKKKNKKKDAEIKPEV